MNIVNKLPSLLDTFLHNSVCWSCGLSHKGKKLVCVDCELAIKCVEAPCVQCGLSHAGKGETCIHCLSKPKLWNEMLAPLSYQNPISHLVQLLKFNQKLDVLKALVELITPQFESITVKPDILIPVPLHKNRYLERGFNQSYEIAKLLSKELGIPCDSYFVERVIDTPRQSELKLKQREKNIKNAFYVDNRLSHYQHIALIDDVITSGSTVHELTKQCHKSGVKKVDVWAVARTEIN